MLGKMYTRTCMCAGICVYVCAHNARGRVCTRVCGSACMGAHNVRGRVHAWVWVYACIYACTPVRIMGAGARGCMRMYVCVGVCGCVRAHHALTDVGGGGAVRNARRLWEKLGHYGKIREII